MKRNRFLAVLLFLGSGVALLAADPSVSDLLAKQGIPSRPGLRGQMDVVGFASTAAQMASILERARNQAAPRVQDLQRQGGKPGPAVAVLCPHDDYAYAGRLYALAAPQVRARQVLLFGVFHKARIFGMKDRLVFDAFPAWRAPGGPVPVSPLREELEKRLAPGSCAVDDRAHSVEHSLEALVPFLQAEDRDLSIVPVLIPYMSWETLDRLADEFSRNLAALMKEKGWELGRDVAIVCSSDGVHYGDSGWGPLPYCPFGTDLAGYGRAESQEREIAASLAGTLSDSSRARAFYERCVDPSDSTVYRVTWCGRFSVPFGLEVARRTAALLGHAPLVGRILDTGTSVSEAGVDVSDLPGMGVTAPASFHHFVGYAALDWR